VTKQDYPQDEFDVLGSNRVPQGVHRTPVPRWRRLLPFVIVLVLAPTLAYLGVSYLANLGSGTATDAPAVVTTEPSADATATAEATPTVEPEPQPTVEEIPVNLDAAVLVLNGSGIRGIASSAADTLGAAGFTTVTTGNSTSSVPTESTVYYANADLATTAQLVATTLGIALVVEDAGATDSVAVVLRRDFTP
jgi:hypothetical protein